MAEFPPTVKDLNDAFVKVSFQEDKEGDPLLGHWLDQGSAKHSYPAVLLAQLLQKLYPTHSIVLTQDYRLNLLAFPGVSAQPISPNELISNSWFIPLPKNAGPVPGLISDTVEYGGLKAYWKGKEFLVYIARWPSGFSTTTQTFVLYEGPQSFTRELLLAAGVWADQLHDELWVFNQFWTKDSGLWQAIQGASWDDVILEDYFKKAIQKDVFGFFSSKDTYKALSLPWKRGLILHGPPGNGKTISLKVIMKECSEQGYSPMYVKSFKSWNGEEWAIGEVFRKARQNSPCVLVLEDLDSLINDQNRSFFLNELDGLEGNDGLLVIGTTNHFDRLDPGLSTRPSRFDRKYLFDDPNKAARTLYAQYWQQKLKDNKDISFPDTLVDEIATETERFSFAYLKEAFVSALVTLLTEKEDGHEISFEAVIKTQIKTLRKQLDKGALERQVSSTRATPTVMSLSPPESQREFKPLLDALTQRLGGTGRSAAPIFPRPDRDVRGLMDGLPGVGNSSWF
ncbi:P-loop containing nucleoside triphosphate hydrolase protein [Gloeopeniophorella convolvens]|nr:P-loop containing nucleoside triphosphate hydrolase protein [Gloeopeniophorella convolvens]